MAKKRRRTEEKEEAFSFRFPEFSESEFLAHEFEQSYALLTVVGLMLLIGIVSWAIDFFAPLFWYLPIVIGVAVIAFSPSVVQRIRPAATTYKKTDWAGLIAVQFFGWLGLWFLLLNVLPR